MAARRSSKRKEAARVRPRRLPASWAIAVVALALVGGGALVGISMATRSDDEEVPSGAGQTVVATQHLCASGSLPAEERTCGQDSAPVKIVELSDYQCPFCKRFVDLTEPQVENEYIQKGLVHLEFHNFAITAGSAPPDENEATLAAEAAECANDQGHFWEYHYKLYAEQAGENRGAFLPDKLKQFASDLGLDREQFDACLDSHEHINLIIEERQQAADAGANGTPSFLINGKLVVGFMTFDEFSQQIEEALAKQ
jgi:protein-disulfide isomerase